MSTKIALALILTVFSITLLFGDIIITRNDMILNGKILEENKDSVKFGNYHGIFTIDRSQIKEIFRTDSYEGDVKILKGLDRTVNEAEVKTNYEAGIDKLDARAGVDRGRQHAPYYMIAVSPFYMVNYGKLGNVLPNSYGLSISGDIPAGKIGHAKRIFISDVRVGAEYLRSEKDERKVTGFRASAGPRRQFPLSIGSFRFEYSVSALAGAGWYAIQGILEETRAVKWNAAFVTGFTFTISSITLSPEAKLDYIYDAHAPLYGIGFVMSLGYRF